MSEENKSEEKGKVVGSDTIKGQACISGKPEEHVRLAREYIDLGFTHLFFRSASPDGEDFINRYGRDVLPKIRAEAGG